MNNCDIDKAWEILVEHKSERKESRVALIAALIETKASIGAPHIAEAFAVELVRLAGAIKALCEADCSVGLTPTQEKRQATLAARFAAIAEALGFEAHTGGDPRGACAYLIDPADRKGDGWGEGWAVYH